MLKVNNNSLAYMTWNCKYHIAFTPKYKRKAFYGEKRKIKKAIEKATFKKGGAKYKNCAKRQ